MRASATAAAAARCGDYYYCDTETGRRYCFEPKSHGVHLFATTSTLICDICFDGHPQICLGCSHLTEADARRVFLTSPNTGTLCIQATLGTFPHCGVKQNQQRLTDTTVACASRGIQAASRAAADEWCEPPAKQRSRNPLDRVSGRWRSWRE
jgi:hypothetical protein